MKKILFAAFLTTIISISLSAQKGSYGKYKDLSSFILNARFSF